MHLVFILYGLFAAIFIVCKLALGYSPPLFLVGSRMILAGALILLYCSWKKKGAFQQLHIKNLYPLFGLAFFNIYLTNACEVWGLQYLSSAKTCFIYSLSPFVSALLSFAIFSERLTIQKWIGLIIGFVGFIPIMVEQSPTEGLMGSFWVFSWPELAVCTAAASSVYGWILLRQLIQGDGLSPLLANGLSMLIGGMMALGHSVLSEDWNPLPISDFLPFLFYSSILIIISNLICYNLYGSLLKRYTATFMSFAGFTTPLFTALFGWICFDEKISWGFCGSMLIVFAGLSLFYRDELREGYAVANG